MKDRQIIKIQQLNSNNTITILAYITDACNYDCYYCYNDKPRKNKFLDLDVFSTFIESMYMFRKQNMYIELIGGETLLHKDLMKFIQKMYKYYPNIKFGIYSNFSFPVDTYIKYLEYGVYMTLTWHSLPLDIENIEFIEKVKKLPKKYFSTIAEIHVMYENKYLNASLNAYNKLYALYPESTELALLDHDYNTKKIYFCDNCQYTQQEVDFYKSTQSNVAARRKFFTITYDDNTIENISLTTASNNPKLSHCKYWQCDAGYNNFYIYLNGNIFPCQSYVKDVNGFKTNYSIGNIFLNNDAKTLQYKKQLCKVDTCYCSWEVCKQKIFK